MTDKDEMCAIKLIHYNWNNTHIFMLKQYI